MDEKLQIIDVWVAPFCDEKINLWKDTGYINQTKLKEPDIYKNVDDLIKEMDRNGVKKAIVSGTHSDSPHDSTQWIWGQVRKYPDRLYGCAGVDPRKGMAAVRELETAVRELGFIGLRIWPYACGYPPNHNIYYPLYAKCVELGIPVTLQVGHTAPALPSEVGRPIYLDEVALFFPELTIIASHIGWPWTDEMISLAWKHPNVYIDTTMHVPKYFPPEFVHYMKTFGKDKVLYGSSWPLGSMERALKELDILEMPEGAKKKYFWENAIRAWKLDK